MPPFVQGTLIGFSIAAPVGPIGLLCIRRSLNEGRLAGFISGLGAASADGVYGVVAASGVSALTSALLKHQSVIQLLGSTFLVYLGVTIIRTPQVQPVAATNAHTTLLGAYVSTFVLTLANPATILSFVGIFAGVGIGNSQNTGSIAAALMVVGVFVGSACWWLILSTTAGWLGVRISRPGLRLINLLAGAILLGLTAWQLVTLYRRA